MSFSGHLDRAGELGGHPGGVFLSARGAGWQAAAEGAGERSVGRAGGEWTACGVAAGADSRRANTAK